MRPIQDPQTLWQFEHLPSDGTGGPGLFVRAAAKINI